MKNTFPGGSLGTPTPGSLTPYIEVPSPLSETASLGLSPSAQWPQTPYVRVNKAGPELGELSVIEANQVWGRGWLLLASLTETDT